MIANIFRSKWFWGIMCVVVVACGRMSKYDPPLTQEFMGYEISVIALEHAGRSYDHPLGLRWNAASDKELFVVHLRFTSVSAMNKIHLTSAIECADGSFGRSDQLSGMLAVPNDELTQQDVFTVRKGQKPKKLYICVSGGTHMPDPANPKGEIIKLNDPTDPTISRVVFDLAQAHR